MAEPAVDISHTLARGDAIPNDFVVPFNLQDRPHLQGVAPARPQRISTAHVLAIALPQRGLVWMRSGASH